MPNIGAVSYALGATLFLLLTAVLLTGWRGRLQGGLLVTAAAVSCAWAGLLAMWSQYSVPGRGVVHTIETLRYLAWFAFLLNILEQIGDNGVSVRRLRSVRVVIYTLAGALLLLPLFATDIYGMGLLPRQVVGLVLVGFMLLSVIGIWLVEILFRNTRVEQRWAIKFLCLGIGGMFVYDFYMYSYALLFKQVDVSLWQARGAVNALVAPMIAVSAARNPQWSLDVFVSRRVVYYTTTFMGAGSYLLLMAAAGYYISTYGGEWGAVLRIVFLFVAIGLLLALLYSGRMRAQLRVSLSKHFFNYKYDYRDQWLRFTRALSSHEPELQPRERVIRAVAEIMESPGGMLWQTNDRGLLERTAHWNMREPPTEPIAADAPLTAFLARSGWVIRLDEYRDTPGVYPGVSIPDWLVEMPRAWLIVPLINQERLLGFIVLAQPLAQLAFDWEVSDLLKTVATQAAAHLAQLEALAALAESRQFEGFNRLSAFVLHDLKNIIAQQMLVVNSAARHKHNPEFIEDAVRIMAHSVSKMQRLMESLRGGSTGADVNNVDIVAMLRQAARAREGTPPQPQLALPETVLTVTANADRLTSVLENIIQNAQEATGKHGRVTVGVEVVDGRAQVSIADDGCGMDPAFIRDRLFRPFDTTKGDTGMGIGAYESRSYLRSIGGDMLVESAPGQGTTVRLVVPLAACTVEPVTTHNESRGIA